MKDNLYDFRTWPQAGRDQLERALLQGKQRYLQKQLATATLGIGPRRAMEAALQEVQDRLGKLKDAPALEAP